MLGNGGLAAMLGRADLSAAGVAPPNVPRDRYDFGSRNVQQGGMIAQPANGVGRLALGILVGGVVTYGAFYMWTRSHQEHHFHTSVDQWAIGGLGALLFLNVWKVVSAKAAAQSGALGQVGAATGSLVHFGGGGN